MNTHRDDPMDNHPDEERLNDFVDAALSDPEMTAIERHLERCAPCAAEVAELRDLLARAAALPRNLPPARDLWTGIRAECDTETAAHPRLVAVPRNREPRERHPLLQFWLPLAAAALALIILSSSLTRVWMKPGGPFAPLSGSHEEPLAAVNRVLLPRVAPSTPVPGGSVQNASLPTGTESSSGGASKLAPGSTLGAAEQTFEKASADLRAAFETRKSQLKPKTVATVEENLRIIDDAIQRARAALEADPGNPGLNAMVAATWQKKVDLLEKAVRLSSEI